MEYPFMPDAILVNLYLENFLEDYILLKFLIDHKASYMAATVILTNNYPQQINLVTFNDKTLVWQSV